MMTFKCITFPDSPGVTILMLTLMLSASCLGRCMANNNNMTNGSPAWRFGGGWPSYNSSKCPFSHRNRTHGPTKILVGGSNNWNFGFNYTDWSLRNSPFYLDDVLVFKYAAPVNGSPGHSVYLLPDFWSYMNCDLRRGKRIASPTQGGAKGFEFKLSQWQPHYFACGQHNGIHCKLGLMKFFVMPIFRSWT